jgi:hypothetical protein
LILNTHAHVLSLSAPDISAAIPTERSLRNLQTDPSEALTRTAKAEWGRVSKTGGGAGAIVV